MAKIRHSEGYEVFALLSEETKPAVNPQSTGETLPLTVFTGKSQMEK